jgi:hypothetical protein
VDDQSFNGPRWPHVDLLLDGGVENGAPPGGNVLQEIRNRGKLPSMSNSYLSHVNRVLIDATAASSRSKAGRKNFREFHA